MSDDDRREWLKNAGVLQVQLQGVSTPLYLTAKVFKSGSVGWFLSQKAVVGEIPCQVNLCITGIKTKRETVQKGTGTNGTVPSEEPQTPQGLFTVEEVPVKPTRSVRKRPRAS